MSLFSDLSKAKSEEDVKDAYIRALGLKPGSYSKNRVDIETDEIWFEAKASDISTPAMFTQLLWYVRDAQTQGDPLPSFLSTINRSKAALGQTQIYQSIYEDNSIDWGQSASALLKRKDIIENLTKYIERHTAEYTIGGDLFNHQETDETAYIDAVKKAIDHGVLIKTEIVPINFRKVFERWMNMIGNELTNIKDKTEYATIFIADLLSDGKQVVSSNSRARLLFEGENPLFAIDRRIIELASTQNYYKFWRIYNRPPLANHFDYMIERRDQLIPIDEKKFKGAFYTPFPVVDKAYEYLNRTLGANWQDEYYVWDMCCGVGNLFHKNHRNPRNLFLSTLDQADIDIMKRQNVCPGAEIFQYDYLNDDVNKFITGGGGGGVPLVRA